jgi:uncharacterized protein YfaP (DUF2135 family)
MLKKRLFFAAICGPALLVLASRCGRHATEPGPGRAVFVIKPHFSESPVSPGRTHVDKSAGLMAVDQVRILVLDLSRYDSWQEFIATEKGQRFHEVKHGDFMETVTWADWQKFYATYFTVVSDQSLEVNDTTATGTVTGVIGLNRFVIAFIQGDTIRYSGEADAQGREQAQPQEVDVSVERWEAGTRPSSIAVRTEPPGAAVYLDGTNMNMLTPAVLRDVSPGNHLVRLYLAGYNEINAELELGVSASRTIDTTLVAPGYPRPVFTVTEPADSARFPDNVIHVRGSIELQDAAGGRTPYSGAEAVLMLNGVEKEVTVSGGAFDETISIASGENLIQVRANSAEGNTGVSDPLHVFGDFQGANIEITLTWNSPTSDLDLYVWNPNGELAYFSNKQISDGFLDIDDTQGYGPETFTSNNAIAGVYVVKVNRYSMHFDTTSDATVQIQLNGRTPRIYGPHRFSAESTVTWDVASFTYSAGASKAAAVRPPEWMIRKIEEDLKAMPPK